MDHQMITHFYYFYKTQELYLLYKKHLQNRYTRGAKLQPVAAESTFVIYLFTYLLTWVYL
jgi:hypothetical protein